MRIIAGKYKGRRLVSFTSQKTRPLLDQIKESLFNILQFQIAQKRILDLYAGTGGFGLEAISRGASVVYFVEQERSMVNVIHKNVELFSDAHTECTIKIFQNDCMQACASLARSEALFDIIFMDPPYSDTAFTIQMITSLIKYIQHGALLAPEGIVIFRHEKKDDITIPKNILTCYREKHIGRSHISFYKRLEKREIP